MADLPLGRVTLLFSEVEGSTALLQRLGPAYSDVLDGQRQVLRSAWSSHGGVELSTEGDSCFVAFESAPAGVRAACQAQRLLASYPWPHGEQVRVRMGLHTGVPMVHDGEYLGMDVYRAARIAGVAHGGQVVVSARTRELTDGQVDGVEMIDLGRHQLRDLPALEQLYQAKIVGVPGRFPPLRSLGAVSSLPASETPLVGRDGELAELRALVEGGARMVTLTGPGGSGKTRLAVELAGSIASGWFDDGVFFVACSEVATEDGLYERIGEVLDVPSTARTPQTLLTYLGRRHTLVVLDNLEQIDAADTVVSALVAQVPALTVVATSRRPLHVHGEHEHLVPPLGLPRDEQPETVIRSGAVQMFTQHARLVRPEFAVDSANAADVAELCRRLDGLPLALELAAARIKVLGPRAIVARLDNALDLGSSSRRTVPRQRSLRDTIDWSYQLLSPLQQILFRRLAVFAGGADLEAIGAVTQDGDKPASDVDGFDILEGLVDASLVTVTTNTDDGEPRFGLLETIRSYAKEQLAATGELAMVRGRHALHYCQVAEQLDRLVESPRGLEVLGRFALEYDNLREALAWAVGLVAPFGQHDPTVPHDAAENRAQTAVRLVQAMLWFTDIRGFHRERVYWAGLAAEAGRGVDSPGLAHCLRDIAFYQASLDRVQRRALFEESIEMGRRLEDAGAVSLSLTWSGFFEINEHNLDVARVLLDEALALARESPDDRQIGPALGVLTMLAHVEENFEQVLTYITELAEFHRRRGNPLGVPGEQLGRANALRRLRRTPEALEAVSLATQAHAALGFAHWNALPPLTDEYAGIFADLGNASGAARLLGACDTFREQHNLPRLTIEDDDIWVSLINARNALTDDEWDRAYQSGRDIKLEDALTAAEIWRTTDTNLDPSDNPNFIDGAKGTALGLTQREIEVIQLRATGLTANAVGRALRIAPRTVDKHMENSYRKLGCSNLVTALRILAGGH